MIGGNCYVMWSMYNLWDLFRLWTLPYMRDKYPSVSRRRWRSAYWCGSRNYTYCFRVKLSVVR